MENILIIEPFNASFFGMLAIIIFFAIYVGKRFGNQSLDFRRKLLIYIYLGVLAVFITYKLLLPLNAVYMQIYEQNWGRFTYWNELPLNPCNITLIAIPLAAHTMNRPLLSGCFYSAAIGPLLAFFMPPEGFWGYGLFNIYIFGFYFTHMALFVAPILMVKLKLYTPCYKDIIYFVIIITSLALFAFIVNIILRETGLCSSANYFFSIDTEGNPMLILFNKLIPIPFLYLLPGLLLVVSLAFIITAGYNSVVKFHKKYRKRSGLQK